MAAKHSSDYIDSKLITTLIANETHHTFYTSGRRTRRRREKRGETWRWEKELGNGTFGRVWLETCVSGESSGRLRAVKEVKKDFDGAAVDYTRELEAAVKFSLDKYVDCFVKSFGWFETETTIRIAMEYMKYGDLRHYMNRPFEDAEAKAIAWQLAEGLEMMHVAGFAHRDLKPANILVEEKGPNWWVKIGDFGICKRAEMGATAFRTIIGTRGYIAPEVLGLILHEDTNESTASFSYTRAVDIWALGEVIFRLRTQTPAFPNPVDLTRYALWNRMAWMQPLRDSGAREGCCDFIMRAMAADPRERMTAAEAMAHPWVQSAEPSSGRSSPRPSPDVPSHEPASSSSQQQTKSRDAQEATHTRDFNELTDAFHASDLGNKDQDQRAKLTAHTLPANEDRNATSNVNQQLRNQSPALQDLHPVISQDANYADDYATADWSTAPHLRANPSSLYGQYQPHHVQYQLQHDLPIIPPHYGQHLLHHGQYQPPHDLLPFLLPEQSAIYQAQLLHYNKLISPNRGRDLPQTPPLPPVVSSPTVQAAPRSRSSKKVSLKDDPTGR